jgi:peptidyl-prolyl cis-trans isomerase-like 4
MSVLLQTNIGALTIDLFVKERPRTASNFIKLCKIKYYKDCIFHNVQPDYLVQSGDPTATGRGGSSLNG